MKYRALFLVFAVVATHAQTNIVDIIPPSPNATAFHVYGNTQVNYYTGATNIIIPIWTIKEGELSLPIYLKYTGGNGIKVEEVASWVGLGWSLNYGGAISRVQRGKADEDPNYGYLYSDFPSFEIDSKGNFEDAFELTEIFKGNRDAEPDLFLYNYPESSGQFYVKKNGSIMLKPLKNLKVTYAESPITIEERTSTTRFIPTNGKLGKFRIKSESGNLYEFDERERSFSYIKNSSLTDKRAFPSSWLLSKIKSLKTNDSIELEYETFSYEDVRMLPMLILSGINQQEQDHYEKSIYMGKRIKTIRFSEGTISFIASETTRKDLKNDKYLKEIVINDNSGALVKKFVFNYKYMTPRGLIDKNAVTNYSNENRLLLSSITEHSKSNQAKPPYQFTYNTDHILPARDSKSQDHWGYYNGKHNSSLLPKHKVNVYDRTKGKWENKTFGKANRAVSSAHTQAGILTGIRYPTGGKTAFVYESHDTNNKDFPGVLHEKTLSLAFPNIKHEISVELDVELFSEIEIKNYSLNNSVNKCFPIFYIKNLTSGEIKTYRRDSKKSDNDNSFLKPDVFNVLLKKGRYEVWYTLDSNVSNNCNSQDPYPTTFSWENETSSKLVGGVRIMRIIDVTNNNRIARDFNYKLSNGLSSGVLNSIPKYSFHVLESYYKSAVLGTNGNLGYFEKQPNGHVHHAIKSFYPLVNVQDSHIGYEKVTVTYSTSGGGKKEYYYTTSKEYPDTYEGKNLKLGVRKVNNNYNYYFDGFTYENHITFKGKRLDLYPVVQVDSKSFLRGLLKRQVNYEKTNSRFERVSKIENLFAPLFFSRNVLGIGRIDNIIDEEENFISGFSTIKVSDGFIKDPWGRISTSHSTNFRLYDFFSGYTVPTITKTTTYSNGLELTSVTEKKHHKDSEYNLFIKWFSPKSSHTQSSNGEVISTKYFYAYDLNDKELLKQNRINKPLKIISFKNEINGEKKLSQSHNTYSLFKNLYLPHHIQTSKGKNALETIRTYHRYDSHANPLEISQKDGPHTVYLYGYTKQRLIAQIQNATFREVATALGISESALEGINENHLAQINGLRAKKPEWMITTYTHIPMVGMKTATDPKGLTTTYEYDDFNHLKHIKDHNGDILKAYDYNYRNE